jgi:hypothetical protein
LLYEIRFGIEMAADRDFPPWLRYGWPWPSGMRQRLGVWQWSAYPGQWPREAFESQFEVLRIRYESPGFVDLAGVGKVVEQVRLFLEKLIDLKATRRREALEGQMLEEDIVAKKIENARNFVRFRTEALQAGISEDEIRFLTYEVDAVQERLLRQVDRGQITAISPVQRDDGSADEA